MASSSSAPSGKTPISFTPCSRFQSWSLSFIPSVWAEVNPYVEYYVMEPLHFYLEEFFDFITPCLFHYYQSFHDQCTKLGQSKFFQNIKPLTHYFFTNLTPPAVPLDKTKEMENKTDRQILREKKELQEFLYEVKYKVTQAAAALWGPNALSFGFRVHDKNSYFSPVFFDLPFFSVPWPTLSMLFGQNARKVAKDCAISPKPTVSYIPPNSPASTLLKEGDTLLKVNGETVNSASHAAYLLRNAGTSERHDNSVNLEIETKEGETKTVKIPGVVVHRYSTTLLIVDQWNAMADSFWCIGIFSGLIKELLEADKEDPTHAKAKKELAMILGHEMTHIHYYHIYKIVGVILLITSIVAEPIGLLAYLAVAYFERYVITYFTRAFEREADYGGAYLSALSFGSQENPVPQGLWERIETKRLAFASYRFFSWFFSHPTPQEREQFLSLVSDEIKGKIGGEKELRPNESSPLPA